MAGSSLLALIDDITTVLDDVALLTKVAAKKTAGLAGDDLAVNTEQVTGVDPRRELPVVWAVAKGSLLNKAILVPAALAISAVAPWAITPLLMLGGLFLCYEGFEKVAHGLVHSKREETASHRKELGRALADPKVDLVAFEKQKIKGAIRTDFILSAEIIAIALGTAAGEPLPQQAIVLAIIALAMTAGVYGVVAAIVKFDDIGLYLTRRGGEGPAARFARSLGRGILVATPWFMKALSVLGTLAMFLVGGGILTHGLHALAEPIESLALAAASVPGIGGFLHASLPVLANLVVGLVAGALVLGAVSLVSRLRRRKA
jgi:predicted DNA repair protein MutK